MFATALIILIGVFYLASGSRLLKSAIMDGLLEQAIARLDIEKDTHTVDRRDQICLAIMAVLTFSGGVFLVLQAGLATVLLVTCFAFQLVYIFYLSPRVEPEIPDNEKTNPPLAAVGLDAVLLTAVIAAQYAGHLPPMLAPWGAPEALGLVGSVAFAGFAWWQLRKQPFPMGNPLDALSDLDDELIDWSEVETVTLALVYADFPVTLELKDGTIYPNCHRVDISETLSTKLLDWSDTFDDAHEFDEGLPILEWGAEKSDAHHALGVGLARELKAELTRSGHDHVDVRWVDMNGDVSSV